MEISVKTLTLFTTLALTGLSAGLFYAWEFSVIPGTKRITDGSYLETMQAINRAIINPWFLTIFMGTVAGQIACTFLFKETEYFWFFLAGTLTYFLGTILVTSFGNVPLNNELDLVNLIEAGQEQIKNLREHYEIKWNRYHTIRTFFSVASFFLFLMATCFTVK